MTAFIPRAHLENMRAWGPTRSYQDRMVVKARDGYRTVPGGGNVPRYVVRESDVPCRLDRNFIQGTENTIGGQLQAITRAVVSCSPASGALVSALDQIEVQPNEDETEPTVIDVSSVEVRRTYDLERVITGIVVGGRGTVTP